MPSSGNKRSFCVVSQENEILIGFKTDMLVFSVLAHSSIHISAKLAAQNLRDDEDSKMKVKE